MNGEAVDSISRAKARLRLIQGLLAEQGPDNPMELSPEASYGLYVLLEDTQDDLVEAWEALAK